jgi:hypothetical protein
MAILLCGVDRCFQPIQFRLASRMSFREETEQCGGDRGHNGRNGSEAAAVVPPCASATELEASDFQFAIAVPKIWPFQKRLF